MNARLLAVSSIVLALAACTPSPAPGTNGSGTPPTSSASSVAVSSAASSSVKARPLSKEGEICGGIAGFQCEPGLFCKYDGAYPDAAGVCIK